MLNKRNRRRGIALAIALTIIPITIGLTLLLFTRIEISLRDTERSIQRTQSRMLAESALAVLQSGEFARPEDVAGTIEGVGAYFIEKDGDTGQLRARGRVRKNGTRIITTMDLRVEGDNIYITKYATSYVTKARPYESASK